MTLLVHSPPPPARKAYARREKSRLSRHGLSLIAQGEPLVWLTGGAIVICLTMILGLLLLVIASGLPTFWPQELIRIERKDAPPLLGEVTRTETFIPYVQASSPGAPAKGTDSAATDSVAADSAAADSAATDSAATDSAAADSAITAAVAPVAEPTPIRRRFMRTGNFELTNEHFALVSDTEIAPQGETRPEWAVTVERLEWGRFYGQPQQFLRRHLRTPTVNEQELVAIQQFFDANRWRLSEDQTERFEKAYAAVPSALEEARRDSVSQFLNQFSDPDRTYEAVLDDGQAIPLKTAEPIQNVVSVREIWSGPAAAWSQFERFHEEVRDRSHERHQLEQREIGHVNDRMEDARLEVRQQELEHRVAAIDLALELKTARSTIQAVEQSIAESQAAVAKVAARFSDQPDLAMFAERFVAAQKQEAAEQLQEPAALRSQLEANLNKLPPPVQEAVQEFVDVQLAAVDETTEIQKKIAVLNDENARYELVMQTADQQEKSLALADIVRAYPANQLTTSGKLGVYLSRWQEFLTEEPREANSEGGVFPAIWGTVVMTLIMSLLVAPFGVLAALYLREYARAGWMVSAIRISISNLAGVPSIVFGVFGLGFFCYVLGSFVDGGPRNAGLTPMPPGMWWMTLAGLAVCGAAAFGCGLGALSKHRHETRWTRWLGYASIALWVTTLVIALMLIFGSPFFHGFFAAALPNPTFGKGGLLWASLTLALLTLPVVIVATEEALAAVPNSLREGSYACGGSKWQTIRRIVLPHAMPGIMTGMILAMARGAGETAPLMLVGAVKLAPDLPIDTSFPFVHFDRSFMHLGFHIFDVGFQSQNSEAAKPMVFTTTLLLILIIATLNFTAVWVRSHLRKRFLGGQF